MVISIIIPAYNAELFLPRCLASVYQTTLSEHCFEVIAINDGSKDNTRILLDDYSVKYHNLTVIDQPNSGVSVARNKGIEIAKGDYLLLLDADDELVDKALEKVSAYLSGHEPIDMLVTRQIRKRDGKERMVGAPSLVEHKRYSGLEAYQNGYIRTNAGGGICRTAFLREHKLFFPEGVKNAEDTVFFGKLEVYAQSIVFYDLPLYIINEVEGSASHHENYTKLGKSLITTLYSVADIKASLIGDREHKAIFDYVVYQLLANTIAAFVSSKELSFRQFMNEVERMRLLPLDTDNMCLMRQNARFMNFSILLFYFVSWVKRHCMR